jgi:methanogenesis imperfect marker protein 11
MAIPSDPYSVQYPWILAITDDQGDTVELVENFDCIGGAMWAQQSYGKSPLVQSVRSIGTQSRFLLRQGSVDLALVGSRFPAGISRVQVEDREVAVRYIGMGGGGVGASACRAYAGGVLRCESDPSGGGRVAGSTIWLSRMQRLLIGVDDTDTPEEGATWTLAHNIAKSVEDAHSRYLSHTIVQLFPVPFRTKNCVSTVIEFATGDPDGLTERFRTLLERYTLSEETGMAVYRGFDPGSLLPYARRVKRGEIDAGELARITDPCLERVLQGRGIIGAVAAIPLYCRFTEALELCDGDR